AAARVAAAGEVVGGRHVREVEAAARIDQGHAAADPLGEPAALGTAARRVGPERLVVEERKVLAAEVRAVAAVEAAALAEAAAHRAAAAAGGVAIEGHVLQQHVV